MRILNGGGNMKQFFLFSVSLLSVVRVASGVTCTDVGNGVTTCRLEVVQDVGIENASNYNYLDYLIIGLHPDYPLKRSLLQFEDPPGSSDCNKIKEAYMYVYFSYAHKPSFQTVDEAPYLKRKARLHVVNEPWLEAEATSIVSMTGVPWSAPYLDLGTDADSSVLTTTTMNISSPSRYVEFKVTGAVKDWASGAVDNNGLLMKIKNENKDGRDMRFYSNAYSDATTHAFINVICK